MIQHIFGTNVVVNQHHMMKYHEQFTPAEIQEILLSNLYTYDKIFVDLDRLYMVKELKKKDEQDLQRERERRIAQTVEVENEKSVDENKEEVEIKSKSPVNVIKDEIVRGDSINKVETKNRLNWSAQAATSGNPVKSKSRSGYSSYGKLG